MITCWNIKFWRGMDQEIILEMEKHQIDICCLFTTYKHHILIYNGRTKQKRSHSVVGMLLYKKCTQSVENIDYVSNRIIMVNLLIILPLKSTYTPDICKPSEKSEQYYEKFQNNVNFVY